MVVTWDELLQFCLVILNIISLVYTLSQTKKK